MRCPYCSCEVIKIIGAVEGLTTFLAICTTCRNLVRYINREVIEPSSYDIYMFERYKYIKRQQALNN